MNIGPAVCDVTGVRAGDRNTMVVTLTQGGGVVDLTGATIEAQARAKPTDPVALSAVVENLNAVAGEFTLRWPGDEVRTLIGTAVKWAGVWDLQVTSAGDTDPVTVCAGKFSADQDVTRAGA